MPPKRSGTPAPPTLGGRTPRKTRKGSIAPVDASPPSAEQAQRLPKAAVALASRLTPRPPRFSTNYGAPAFDAGSAEKDKNRTFTTVSTTDLGVATSRARQLVEESNRQDAEERENAEREAAAAATATAEAGAKRKGRPPSVAAAQGRKRQKTASQAGSDLASRRHRAEAEESVDHEMSDVDDEVGVQSTSKRPANGRTARRGRSAGLSAVPQPSSNRQGLRPNKGLRQQPRTRRGTSSDEVDLVHPYDDGGPSTAGPSETLGVPGPATGGGSSQWVSQERVVDTPASERSFNMESGLYQQAAVQTPEGSPGPPGETPSGPRPRVSSLQAASASPIAAQASIPAHERPPSMGPSAPSAPAPSVPSGASSVPFSNRSPSVDDASVDEHAPPPKVTYSYYADPPHAGVRQPSESPYSKPTILVHKRVDLEIDKHVQPPLPDELQDPHVGMANQAAIRNVMLPPETFVPRRDPSFDAVSLRRSDPPVRGLPGLAEPQRFVRSHSQDPEFARRTNSGAAFAAASGSRGVRAGSLPLGDRQPGWPSTAPAAPPVSDEPLRRRPRAARDDPISEETEEDGATDQAQSRSAQSGLTQSRRRPSLHSTSGHDPKHTTRADSRPRSKWRTYLSEVWDQGPLTLLLISFIIIVLASVLVPLASIFKPREFEGHSLDTGLRWYGVGDWRNNLGQFVPWSSALPRPALDKDQYSHLADAWKSHERAIADLKKADKLSDAAIARLSDALPMVIKLQPDKNGRPVISDDFWRALRDLAIQDDDVLTLHKSRNGNQKDISDKHWAAIASRIGKKPRGEVYEKWLRDNKWKVNSILGVEPDRQLGDKEIEELVRKHVEQDRDVAVQLVGKSDFIKMLRDDFGNDVAAVRAELAALHDKHKDLLRLIKDAKPTPSPDQAPVMTEKELRQLAQQELRRAIGDMQLEALAKGRISDGLRTVGRKNEINYFTVAAGAVINEQLTTPAYQPPASRSRLSSFNWRRDNALPYVAHEAVKVMTPWFEDGECFCAGARHANVAFLTARIVPQHLVVEHISALETVQPGAIPRGMEVWAEVDESSLRKAVTDWSFATFPPSSSSVPRPPELHERFVKIAEFTFENTTTLEDPATTFPFSSFLTEVGAATEHIVVRAVSNHGANHTCFYRLRMYGKPAHAELPP